MLRRTLIFSLLACVACASEGVVVPLDTGEQPEPEPEPEPEPRELVHIEAAAGSACVTRADGRVYCWGTGPLHTVDEEEVDLSDLPPVVQVAGFIEYGCALLEDGGVSCWGFNHYHQLGGAAEQSATVAEPLRLPHVRDAVSLAAGHHHVCVRDEHEQALCWGWSYSDALLLGRPTAEPVPVDLDGPARLVSAGLEALCVVQGDDRLVCQGQVRQADPFSGHRAELDLPIRPVGLHVGWGSACVWDDAGEAWCLGELGGPDGSLARFELDEVKQLAVTYSKWCAIVGQERRVVCEAGTDLSGLDGVAEISVAGGLTCALTLDDRVACWAPADAELTWIEIPD